MKVPMRFVYLAIPVGCGTMFIHALDALLGLLTGRDEAAAGQDAQPDDEKKEVQE